MSYRKVFSSGEKSRRESFHDALGRSRRDFLKLGLATSAAALFASRTGTSFGKTAQRTGRVLTGASPGDLAFLSLSEASELVRTKRISPVELTNACLARIEALQPDLNAFITVTAEAALDQARKAEAEIQQGRWRGPLHGIPIGFKDAFDTAGVRTTAASRLFLERIPDEDAESVRRLREAGAIFLGKQNLDEFQGGVGIFWTGYFGEVHNPWDLSRYAGAGSSSGSAGALAAGLCYGALGADTGGSIRGPASGCGIVGLKPTYGRVSKRGVIPHSWSLDHAGPMTRTVVDNALMLQMIAGYDENDTTTVDVPVPDYVASLEEDTNSLRVGVPRAPYFEDLNPEVDAAVSQALSVLKLLTAGIQEIDLQPLDLAFPTSEFLASDTGIGKTESWTFHEPYVRESPELYSPEALENLRRYAQNPASDYIRHRRDLDVARRAIAGIFSEVDLLVTPTVPDPAHQIGQMPRTGPFRNMNRFDIYGLPAISVPCGFTSSGLPIGLQIVGPHWAEGTVLRLAHAYERATDWHNRHPDL